MNTKGYIICLEDFENSMEWAQHALTTGQKYGWNVELYQGVNGHKITLQEKRLRISHCNKKCVKAMTRPGTAGCFMSHFSLWEKCASGNEPIEIFEHDVEFLDEPPIVELDFDVLKYEGFNTTKPIPTGNWWEGARAYKITPRGAQKIVNWVRANGAMPADWMLCDGIVNIGFDLQNRVKYNKQQFSFTRDL